jgi:hypothetical protein
VAYEFKLDDDDVDPLATIKVVVKEYGDVHVTVPASYEITQLCVQELDAIAAEQKALGLEFKVTYEGHASAEEAVSKTDAIGKEITDFIANARANKKPVDR